MPLSPTTASWASNQWSSTLPYSKFREQAERICANPDSYLAQGRLGTCGPIAVLHALAMNAKDEFLKFADEVYLNPQGIPNDLKKEQDFGNRFDAVSVALSTYLINHENHLMKYHATLDTMDYVAGGMMPEALVRWTHQFFPQKKVETYSSYFWGVLDNAQKVNQLWNNGLEKPIIFALVNGACLKPDSHLFTHKLSGIFALAAARGHFIQVTSPFCETPEGKIEFEAFTWGSTKKYQFSKAEFKTLLLELITAQ